MGSCARRSVNSRPCWHIFQGLGKSVDPDQGKGSAIGRMIYDKDYEAISRALPSRGQGDAKTRLQAPEGDKKSKSVYDVETVHRIRVASRAYTCRHADIQALSEPRSIQEMALVH